MERARELKDFIIGNNVLEFYSFKGLLIDKVLKLVNISIYSALKAIIYI
jgi:hypothetical protein